MCCKRLPDFEKEDMIRKSKKKIGKTRYISKKCSLYMRRGLLIIKL